MNTKTLRIFVEVANAGGFSAAARKLGLTQPAVSSHIRSLEKEFGSTLIDRSTGRSRLTDAGISFLRHARKMLDMEERMRRDMEGWRAEVAGPLKVAASNIPGEYIMPSVLARLRARHPLVEPRLEIADSSAVLQRVRGGEVDLGCVGWREEDARLRYGVLCEDRLAFIAPPGHPLAERREVEPADLAGAQLLLREEGSGTRAHMLAILSGLGLEVEPGAAMVLGSTMAVIQSVAAGEGLSVVSMWAAAAHIRLGLVAALAVGARDLRRDFHYVLLKRRPPFAAAAALLEMLEDEGPRLAQRLEELAAGE